MKKLVMFGLVAVLGSGLMACGNGQAAEKQSSSSHSASAKVATKKSSSSKKASSASKASASSSSASSSSVVASSSASSTAAASTSSSAVASSSSSQAIQPITRTEAVSLVGRGGFADFHYDQVAAQSTESHALPNGGYALMTFPGAKGQDIFTLTPRADGTVNITAQYGSLDGGGFTLLPNQAMYGRSSAVVTR